MKLSSRNRYSNRNLDLSTTGFIDVVFLLLIFFLVTSTFLMPERQMQSNIAVQKDSSASSQQDLEPAVVRIALASEIPTYTIGAFVTDDETKLNEFLADFVNKQDGAFVRADGDVPFAATAKAIAACRINGFQPVTYVPNSSSGDPN